MKYLLSLVLALGLGSVVYATDCHQNFQRVQVNHCAQNVVVTQPYAVVVPLEVAYPHQNFVQIQQFANVDYGYNTAFVERQVNHGHQRFVEKQVVRQVNRVGLIERLRSRQQALRDNRQANKAQVVVKEKVVVRNRNLGGY